MYCLFSVDANIVSQNVAPVPEQPTITVQEVVARKMLKLRTKLGITTDDLLPASAAFESEQEFQSQGQRRSDKWHGAPSGQDEANVDEGSRPTTNSGRCETATLPTPDIGRWKKEADDMLSLLGTNADKCVHEYPMTELRRKVLPPSVFTDVTLLLEFYGPVNDAPQVCSFCVGGARCPTQLGGGRRPNISAGLNFHV